MTQTDIEGAMSNRAVAGAFILAGVSSLCVTLSLVVHWSIGVGLFSVFLVVIGIFVEADE